MKPETDTPTLKIKPEFQKLIPPLSDHEKEGLEAEIRYWARCYSPIITWKGYIADGHHRYAICQKYGLPFKTEELEMDDEEDVLVWMIDNQIESRRNIESAAKIRLGLKKESILSDKARNRQACGQGGVLLREKCPEANDEKGRVREIIGKSAGVSGKTVDKFKYIEENAPELADDLCTGKVVDGKKISIDGAYRDLRREKHKASLKAAEFPNGKYRVIYADPPWKYNDDLIESYGAAEKHYPTMSIDELCALPIKDVADDSAVLFLWVTSPFLEVSFKVIHSWGFNYKTSFIWDKVKHNMGHYNSVRHEMLLICTRGSCIPDDKKLFDSVQTIERSDKHSEKPEEFREIIETLYKHGNKLELFARKKTEGWEVYGNEVGLQRKLPKIA